MDLLTPCPAPQAAHLCDDLLVWAIDHLPGLAAPDKPSLARSHLGLTIDADGVGFLPIAPWQQGHRDAHGVMDSLDIDAACAYMLAHALSSRHEALAWRARAMDAQRAMEPIRQRLLDMTPYLTTPHVRLAVMGLYKRPEGESAVSVPQPFLGRHMLGVRVALQGPTVDLGFPDFPGLDITASHRPAHRIPPNTYQDKLPPHPVALPLLLQRLSAFRPGTTPWSVNQAGHAAIVWAHSPEEATLLAQIGTHLEAEARSPFPSQTDAAARFLCLLPSAIVDPQKTRDAYARLCAATPG